MAGYLYVVSKRGKLGKSVPSPVLALETFRRKAVEAFDRGCKSAKSGGSKLGDVEEFEVTPFEESGEDRVVMRKCSGSDKEGEPIAIVLERFHVGGQLEARHNGD